MKRWKLWLFLTLLVMVIGAIALTSAVWNNLSSEWQVEAAAAQYALDHSPIEHIDEHDVFTSNGAQEVFEGTDSFGRKWYAFVYGMPFQVHSVRDVGILNQTQILSMLRKSHLTPLKEEIGYLDAAAQSAFGTQTDVIWAAYTKDSSGHASYKYYDARSGNELKLP